MDLRVSACRGYAPFSRGTGERARQQCTYCLESPVDNFYLTLNNMQGIPKEDLQRPNGLYYM